MAFQMPCDVSRQVLAAVVPRRSDRLGDEEYLRHGPGVRLPRAYRKSLTSPPSDDSAATAFAPNRDFVLCGKSIAVVVPAYNEACLIRATLDGIPTFVDHIIVVDDASVDDTASLVRDCSRQVELLRHRANRGVGAAVATGCKRALSIGADITAVMAADGQMDPLDLRALVAPLVLGRADYAHGNRLVWPSVSTLMPRHRWVGNHVLSFLTRKALRFDVSDSQCGYAALTWKAKQALDWDRLWTGYGYPNDLLSRVILRGLRVHEVPVRPVYGAARSGIRLHHAIVVIPFVIARAWARRLRSAFGEVALTAWTRSR